MSYNNSDIYMYIYDCMQAFGISTGHMHISLKIKKEPALI